MHGKLILVIGPSGSGKGALIAYLRTVLPDIVFPISCTTRAPRPAEENGKTYHFVTPEEFDGKIAQGAFLEYASYGGNRYGTLKSEILPALMEGKTVMPEVEVQGARSIATHIPKENLATIFVTAGPWEDLQKRIQARAPISQTELAERRNRYEDEMSFMKEADISIQNPDGQLQEAQQAFLQAVERLRK